MHGATMKIIIYTLIYFKSSAYNIFIRNMNKINIIDQVRKEEENYYTLRSFIPRANLYIF